VFVNFKSGKKTRTMEIVRTMSSVGLSAQHGVRIAGN
jgi:hypothetical protein